MEPDAEELVSWAVEVKEDRERLLVLLLNGRRFSLSPVVGEMIGGALRRRAAELNVGEQTAEQAANWHFSGQARARGD